jgi:hypothetical protein
LILNTASLLLSISVIAPSPSRFEVRGRFAGFFRDIFGKRRMVLRVEGDELFLVWCHVIIFNKMLSSELP